MILQALYDYYQRKAADSQSGIAPEGWEWKPIPFIVVIDFKGKFLQLSDTRENEGKRKVPKQYLLPRGIGRAGPDSWKVTNLFWDHYGYVFGVPKDDEEKSKEMAQKQRSSFIQRLEKLPSAVKKLPAVAAVLKFYETKEYAKVSGEQLQDCLKIAGCNLTFRIKGQDGIITEDSAIKAYVNSLIKGIVDEDSGSSVYRAVCLITGQKGLIQQKHARTPINKDTKSLVAIQKNSGYDSYAKQQAFNCPVSPSAEFAYTTALNTLLKSRNNRIQIADTSVIFWAQKQVDGFNLESEFAWYFRTEKDNTEKGVKAVQNLYEALSTGRLPLDEGNRFYVLGLAPNAARISVRLWKTGTVKDFAERIRQHFDDINIIHADFEIEYCTLNELLAAISVETRDVNKKNRVYFRGRFYDVPPNLAGAVVESVLDGSPYPTTLLQQCMRRIRAEVSRKDQNGKALMNVTRPRAAILKACLNRFNRFYYKSEKEVTMALDRSNVNTEYRLGRLFAVLEKIQEEANPGINATIRDRFYGAASATPITVFPQLLKLKNHHLAKLNPGRKVNFEKEIGEIFDAVKDELPAYLTLNAQARFAVGYYHQRQDFFKKKEA